MSARVQQALGAHGFALEQTGGNCEAYTRRTAAGGTEYVSCAECTGWAPERLRGERVVRIEVSAIGGERTVGEYASVVALCAALAAERAS